MGDFQGDGIICVRSQSHYEMLYHSVCHSSIEKFLSLRYKNIIPIIHLPLQLQVILPTACPINGIQTLRRVTKGARLFRVPRQIAIPYPLERAWELRNTIIAK